MLRVTAELSSRAHAAPLTPLTPQQSEIYARLQQQRAAAEELERQTRRGVGAALEAGLGWPLIAAALGTDVRAARASYGKRVRTPTASVAPLTALEQTILVLVREGWTNQAIAESLYVSKRSLETHLTALYGALGVTSKAELRGLWDECPSGPRSLPRHETTGSAAGRSTGRRSAASPP